MSPSLQALLKLCEDEHLSAGEPWGSFHVKTTFLYPTIWHFLRKYLLLLLVWFGFDFFVVCLNKQLPNIPPVICRYKVRLEDALPPCTPLCSPGRGTSSAPWVPHLCCPNLGSACHSVLHHSSTLWQGPCKCLLWAELRAFSFPRNAECT